MSDWHEGLSGDAERSWFERLPNGLYQLRTERQKLGAVREWPFVGSSRYLAFVYLVRGHRHCVIRYCGRDVGKWHELIDGYFGYGGLNGKALGETSLGGFFAAVDRQLGKGRKPQPILSPALARRRSEREAEEA